MGLGLWFIRQVRSSEQHLLEQRVVIYHALFPVSGGVALEMGGSMAYPPARALYILQVSEGRARGSNGWRFTADPRLVV